MATNNQEQRDERRGCGFGCLVMLGLLGVCGLVVAALFFTALRSVPEVIRTGGLAAGRSGSGTDEVPHMHEVLSYGTGEGEAKVVRIPVTGMIMLGDSSWRGSGTADTALRAIRRATHDPEVKGLLLEVDSGGGGITDSDIIYKALLDFKAARKGRVVVTLMGDVAASGAYYIALASDFIMAHPTTITGSIGVLMQAYNVRELAEKIGVRDVTVKSGANKDLMNPFKEVDPAQRELLQRVVSAMHARFVGLVAENRKLPAETVAPLADGRIFLAQEAVEHKLIDGIGYAADAREKVASLLMAAEVDFYRYAEQPSLMEMLGRPGLLGIREDLRRCLEEGAPEPKMMYRWSL